MTRTCWIGHHALAEQHSVVVDKSLILLTLLTKPPEDTVDKLRRFFFTVYHHQFRRGDLILRYRSYPKP